MSIGMHASLDTRRMQRRKETDRHDVNDDHLVHLFCISLFFSDILRLVLANVFTRRKLEKKKPRNTRRTRTMGRMASRKKKQKKNKKKQKTKTKYQNSREDRIMIMQPWIPLIKRHRECLLHHCIAITVDATSKILRSYMGIEWNQLHRTLTSLFRF